MSPCHSAREKHNILQCHVQEAGDTAVLWVIHVSDSGGVQSVSSGKSDGGCSGRLSCDLDSHDSPFSDTFED